MSACDLHAFPWVLVGAATIGGLLWFSWDMRSILKSTRWKNQLSLEGRWQELEAYYLGAERTLRPFVRLHRKYLLPGNLETQYALFLHTQGRHEEALVKVDQAIRRNKNKPGIFRSYYAQATFATLCGALRARTLILTGLGRYDEARGAAAELKQLRGPRQRANSALALCEYFSGHLEAALAEAQATPAEDPQLDAMRGLVALTYCHQGEYPQALQALAYEPAQATKFYSPAGLNTLLQSPEGIDLLATKREKLARIFPPARWVMLARVHVAMEDFAQADRALDEAAKALGPEPGLQMAYARFRACSLAGQGKSQEAEVYIERMRAMTREMPKRARIWECHFAIGRAYVYLGRHPEALAEFTEAKRSVLHPIEKQGTAFWLAKTHEALGHASEAQVYYQQVVSAAIPGWMHEQASAALAC